MTPTKKNQGYYKVRCEGKGKWASLQHSIFKSTLVSRYSF